MNETIDAVNDDSEARGDLGMREIGPRRTRVAALVVLGGMHPRRAVDRSSHFEAAVADMLGARLRLTISGPTAARRLWGSLANVVWEHDEHPAVLYTFRAAGDLIAAVRGKGDYIEWYCSSTPGVVDSEVREALALEGWRPREEAPETPRESISTGALKPA